MILSRLAYCITRVKPNKPKQITFDSWHILTGDTVMLLNGVEKGKTGKVTKVYRKSNKVIVDGINIRYKIRRNSLQTKFQPKSFPVHVSKVSLIDPQKKVPTRITYGYLKEGQKVRISKKSGAIIPKPSRDHLKRQQRGKKRELGTKDTLSAKALQVTYTGEDLQSIKKEFEAEIAEKQRREKYLIFPW